MSSHARLQESPDHLPLTGRLDALAARHLTWRAPWRIVPSTSQRMLPHYEGAPPPRPRRWDEWWVGFRVRRPVVPKALVDELGEDALLAAMTAHYVQRFGPPAKEPMPRFEWTPWRRTVILAVVGGILALFVPALFGAEPEVLIDAAFFAFVVGVECWIASRWGEPWLLIVMVALLIPFFLVAVVMPLLGAGLGFSVAGAVAIAFVFPGWFLFIPPPHVSTPLPTSEQLLERACQHWLSLTGREATAECRREYAALLDRFLATIQPSTAAARRFAGSGGGEGTP